MTRTTWYLATLIACSIASAGSGRETVDLTIFHTSDLHQSLKPLPHIARVVSTHRRKGEPTLFLDAGDYFDRGEIVGDMTRGEAVYGAMSLMGYDAVTMGNHEWSYGLEHFKNMIERYPLQLLVANVSAGRTALPSRHFERTMIRDIQGVKVGIFGMTLNYFSSQKDWSTTDITAAARESIDLLKKQGVRFIIALTHAGMNKLPEHQGPSDPELARLFPDIDIIVGGHCHTRVSNEQVDRLFEETGVIIHQSAAYGQSLGRIDVTLDRATGERLGYRVAQIPIDAGAAGDPEVQRFIDQMYADHFPDHALPAARIQPGLEAHDVGTWVTQFIRQEAGADIAISGTMGGYGFLPPLWGPGDYTLAQLLRSFPNRVILTASVEGQDLKIFFETHGTGPDPDHFNILHPQKHRRIHHAGVHLTFDGDQARVSTDIDPGRTYVVAFSWTFFRPASYPADPVRGFIPSALKDDQLPPDTAPLFYGLPHRDAQLVKQGLWDLLREHVSRNGPISIAKGR